MATSVKTSNEVPVKLYSYWGSSCSWRVRIVLKLKEIPFEIKPIGLSGDHMSAEYLEVNPMGHVPALHIDGHILIESRAIMEYLEEKCPTRPLLPADAFRRCLVREICDIICSDIQPLQNTSVLRRVGEEKKNEWAQHYIKRGFCAIEKILSTSAGKYCVGDDISMADCCLVPQVFNARKFNLDLSPFPLIVRIDNVLKEYSEFLDTHPTKQPDYRPELSK